MQSILRTQNLNYTRQSRWWGDFFRFVFVELHKGKVIPREEKS